MEELFEKINKGMSKAVEQIETWTQMGKYKIELRNVDSGLKKAYIAAGKKIYSLFAREGFEQISKEEVAAVLEQIDALLAERQKVIEKIELLKSGDEEQ